jgi:hypothetical protein
MSKIFPENWEKHFRRKTILYEIFQEIPQIK